MFRGGVSVSRGAAAYMGGYDSHQHTGGRRAMSFHRENIIWQSADGTWSRGFYETHETGRYDDEDYDPEWDVEYDFDAFEWVSTGHATKQSAHDSWGGANPGGCETLTFGDEQAENEKYDDMAAKLWETHSATAAPPQHRWARRGICSGTPKRRVPRYLAKDIADAAAEAARYKLGGYANQPSDVSSEIEQLRARFAGLSKKERADVATELDEGAARISREMEGDGGRRLRRIPPAESKDFCQAQIALLHGLPKESTTQSKVSPAASRRAKTSAKSTSGSFAPKGHSAPDVALG